MIRPYTVIMAYPVEDTGTGSVETYTAVVKTADAEAAAVSGPVAAAKAQGPDGEYNRPEDFQVLYVILGDITPYFELNSTDIERSQYDQTGLAEEN